MKQSLGLVSLVVRDYDEALAFFIGKLGFRLVEDTVVPEQSKRWVVVSPPGAVESQLLLARASTPAQQSHVGAQTGGRVFLFLYTDDFWRDYASYKSKGIVFVREPKEEPYGTVAVFLDLYGNMWDLLQPTQSHLRLRSEAGATFRSHRVLPYQPQSVFEAFARPELLARWWGPDGFTNTFEVFEFKPGGRWKFVMHGPDGSHHPNESVFLELQGPSKLVIQHVSKPRFALTVTLAAHEAGTAITWTQEFEDSALAARIRHIVEPADEQNLDRLLSVLSGG